MTGRQAAELLRDTLPTREHARLVLRAGFAGRPDSTSASLLYDLRSVLELAAWPRIDEDELARACPDDVYVARLSRDVHLDVTRPWGQVAEAVSGWPEIPALKGALLRAKIRGLGRLPWVATLCGHVALCADAVGTRVDENGRVFFDLERPGEWADVVAGHRLPTRRGRPWAILEPGRPGLAV